MASLKLVVTMAFGLESLVAQELKAMGYENLAIDNGYIVFEADFEAALRCNLRLRSASRVFWVVGEFVARDFDELFDNIKALPWTEILPENACFPVADVTTRNSKLFSKSDCQAMTKKAIVEKMKQRYGCERFPETGPLYALRLQIVNDHVRVLLDTGGEGLHKRGYRAHHHGAPIRETLAAAIVMLTRYRYGDDRVVMDPVCGTGTLLIEAAMIAHNIAPGKYRSFALESWPFMDKKLCAQERQAIVDLEKKDLKPKIYGSDADARALEIARKNIAKAGFEDSIFVQKLPLKDIFSKYQRGILIANPPYGERLLEQEEAEELYREMGQVFTTRFPDWSYFIITPHPQFEKLFGRRASKKRKLYNGPIKCDLYQYFGILKK